MTDSEAVRQATARIFSNAALSVLRPRTVGNAVISVALIEVAIDLLDASPHRPAYAQTIETWREAVVNLRAAIARMRDS